MSLKKEHNDIYTFEHFAKAHSRLTVVPKIENDPELLFYPISKEVTIYDKCISDLTEIRFKSRKGLNLIGHVKGDIKDVNIKVKARSSGDIVHEEVSADGKYNIGPLYDNEQYELIVTKEGYNIFPHQTEKGVFVAEILSYITIKFVDEDTNEVIPSVLVAVSSGRTYKNSSYSDENGVAKFIDLYSGTYYLMPLLKEFKFESLSFEVKEGERIDKIVKGKRVAFSVFGKISMISGDSVANVVVQARSTSSNHIEEAVSDKDGTYRIKGLFKDTRYEIRIKDNEDISESHQAIQRSSPQNRVIEVTGGDTKDMNFMVMLPSSKFYISGFVNFQDDDKSIDNGKVELFMKGKEEPISRQKVGMSRLFTFSGLPVNRDYILKVIPRKEDLKFYNEYETEIKSTDIRKSNKDGIFVNVEIPKVIRR